MLLYTSFICKNNITHQTQLLIKVFVNFYWFELLAWTLCFSMIFMFLKDI